jgi:5-methylcytosine-specific restriction endonuclease McrA
VLAQAVLHLPWWLYAVVALGLVASGVENERRRERKAAHRAYLRSPGWKTKRRAALTRAGNRCQDCGRTSGLHVHHLTYVRHGAELDRDLRVLCSKCHAKRHRDGGRLDDNIDRAIGWLQERR